MDFGFSEEQEMLRASVRKLLEAECDHDRVRAVSGTESGTDPELWRRMSELGLPGLLVPEARGGLEMTPVELIVVAEELGRALAPVPFLSSAVAASFLLQHSASDAQKEEWLPALARGETVAAVGLQETSAALDWEPATRAEQQEQGWKLNGSKLFVCDGGHADVIAILAATPGGLGLFLADPRTAGITIHPLQGIDRTRREVELVCEDAVISETRAIVGSHVRHTLDRMRDRYALALAAEMVGNAEAMLRMAVEYGKIRTQFGRPVASFQGLKHMAAELLVGIETGKSLVYHAAMIAEAADRDEADQKEESRAAAQAKGMMSEVVGRVATDTVQMHGGIGFTWEHDLHLHYKRAKWQELSWGDSSYYLDRVAALHGF